MKTLSNKDNIFLVAGRTGGPFLPLQAIATNLPGFEPIYIGVKNSFEQKYAQSNNLKIFYLPEAKLSILSFKKQSLLIFLINILNLVKLPFYLFVGILKSIFLILKFRPKAIFCTGSFLNIPIILAILFLKPFFLVYGLKIKIIVHQQDPTPGLANRFAAKFSDLTSCKFDYTKSKNKNFSKSLIIENPLDVSKFNLSKSQIKQNLKLKNLELYNLIFEKRNNLPLLFIFGGGSGSFTINQWVFNNFQYLIQNFRIIHLTGILQQKDSFLEDFPQNSNYLVKPFFFEEMSIVLKFCDLVICRAGISSISELEFLRKPAFLVPLENSHQELNANLMKDYFVILLEKEKGNWLKIIKEKYPKFFNEVNWSKSNQSLNLEEYLSKVKNIL
jgi:UDP-N-acetylglucosamine--N-acetylmuramyl-(pentapeptide) pyrophosphoryl-undecaprenol N-acetylglucosamine transferase